MGWFAYFILIPTVFVETLDKCFKNVCELDVVLNYSKVVHSPICIMPDKCEIPKNNKQY